MNANIRIMDSFNLRQHVIDYVKNADNGFINFIKCFSENL